MYTYRSKCNLYCVDTAVFTFIFMYMFCVDLIMMLCIIPRFIEQHGEESWEMANNIPFQSSLVPNSIHLTLDPEHWNVDRGARATHAIYNYKF